MNKADTPVSELVLTCSSAKAWLKLNAQNSPIKIKKILQIVN